MKRRKFIKSFALTSLSMAFMELNAFGKVTNNLEKTSKMPLMFIGHGSPMNAILDNDFTRKWKELGSKLEKPKAILVISAHWLTRNTTKVTAMKAPRTIHDFGGFPEELFQQEYPAPGTPEMAKTTAALFKDKHIEQDFEWGLDHGTWSFLKPMYPKAEIPVFQLSIDYHKPTSFHYELGKSLYKLRNKGVLIIGSGNIVHNLYKLAQGTAQPYDWAKEFDFKITSYINDRDFKSVVEFQKLGKLSEVAHPSYDHFLPLLYTLGAVDEADEISYFNDSFDMRSISMRSLLIKSRE